jgi:membrane-bound serine protease (ClpP class)
LRRLAITLLALGAVLGTASAARAQGAPTGGTRPVDVIEVSGLLDDVNADFIRDAIARLDTDDAQALVIQMNTRGGTIGRDEATDLAERIHAAPVPVTIWVGPSGARGYGLAGQLLGAAAVTGMAPGSRIGNFGIPLATSFPLDFGSATAELGTSTMGAVEAREKGALKPGVDDRGTPTLGDFVVVLDGFTFKGQTLDTAEVIQQGDQLRRRLLPDLVPRSYKLDLLPRLMHTVASPPVTYLLLAVGFSLLIFELFTAGVGIAGGVGALCVVLGCYGAVALPTRWWAFALLLVAMFAYAVDVQTGVPRLWTGIGTVAFVGASVFLYDGLSLSWITLLAGIGGVLLAFVVGMPSMVRTRFATPTIGREWMVGGLGEAVVAVDPEGVVLVEGAQWRARTNRATPIAPGRRIRVVAIDGVTLEVEPEEGGARDYRERAAKHS